MIERSRFAGVPILLAALLSAVPSAAEDPPPDQVTDPGELPCGETDLPGELELSFPEAHEGRTRMEGSLVVGPPHWPEAERAFLLEGELVRGQRRVETFRYRFLPPASAGPVALSFVRRPAAGRYRLLYRLVEEGTRRCLVGAREIDVPGFRKPGAEQTGEPAANVRLWFPRGRLLVGKVRFDADVRGGDIGRLAFELDGKRILTRGRPPWTVELDLGSAPRLHRLAAVGLDRRGRELARDEVLLNAGPHRFSLRLSLARSAQAPEREIEARAIVEVPEGERLAGLDLLVNDELRATLYQPPFVMTLPRPEGAGSAWVRAIARLEEGGVAEQTRFLGSGASDLVEVDFVELLATVVDRRGRPVENLTAEEIELREDGRPQRLRRFERVEDVPIHAAVMIDTSNSMVEELDEAERAALSFFEQVLTPRDRAAVITFADEPELAVRFTSRVDRLAGGLAELSAQGTTTLWDSLAFALHYFAGLEGKRALILLSDGEDAGSEMRYDDVLDYARRSGVAIYTIGLDVKSTPVEIGLRLDQLARETGGRSFRIQRAAELDRTYEEIESELRSQYLLAYQSDAAGGEEYRKIEVEIRRPGVDARTAAGYYP